MNSVTQTLKIPNQLFTRLTATALLSCVAILACSAYGLHHLYKGYVIESARNNAIRLGQMLQDTRLELLNTLGLESRQAITQPTQLQQLDDAFSAYLAPYNILKVKVFSRDGLILYSTDHNIIGHQDTGNQQLLDALSGIPYSTIQTREHFLDLKHETRFDVDVVETYVPIYGKQNVIIGAFEIYQDTTFEYNQVRQGIILSTAALALILAAALIGGFCCIRRTAIALSQAQLELGNLACTDPVTGICNRREILHRGEAELERLRRNITDETIQPLSLCMIDVDHFKQVNDLYGHPAGDEALRLVAERIRKVLRLSCHVGRYGGEEFMVLIPNANLSEAEMISERLLHTIADASYRIQHHDIQLTASIGFATTRSPDATLTQLLQAADNNLYAAKMNGRNCFVGANHPE